MKKFGVGILGCGFVADYYAKTFRNYPWIDVVGVWDHDPERLSHFSKFHGFPAFASLEQMLGDRSVDLVVNLTNPRSHYVLSKRALEAGKHVYTEKPLAMDLEQARELVELAKSRKLSLASAPCSLLGAQAQTVWQLLKERVIGEPYSFSARLHEGLLHKELGHGGGTSPSGILWPWKDELEVGCTLEHAGYYLTWLTAFFGPVESVVSQAAVCVKDKRTREPLDIQTPDFTSAVLTFRSGIVGTISCSIVMPNDRGLTIVGEEGTISTDDCWFYEGNVYVQKSTRVDEIIAWLSPRLRPLRELPGSNFLFMPTRRRVSRIEEASFERYEAGQGMDFARGPAEMLAALAQGRPSGLPMDHALHVNEITLAMQYPDKMGYCRRMETSFEPFGPTPRALIHSRSGTARTDGPSAGSQAAHQEGV